MPNCSFCDNPISKGTGTLYVKKDGTLFYFCSSKCRKNALLMGREGRRQKWTVASRKFKAGVAKRAAGKQEKK
jgi:large subunit ribosomal protein L24e